MHKGVAGVVRQGDHPCPRKSIAQRQRDAVAFTRAKPDEDEIRCQCLEELELIATVETSDDVDRRSLCDQLANDVAQQRGYRHRDRPDTPHLIGRAHSRATAIPHSADAARKSI